MTDEKTLVVIAIGVTGAVITQIAVLLLAYLSFKRERRTKRADEARNQLIAGADALERFHWTIQGVLEFVTDAGQDASEKRRDPKAWQKMVKALEEARENASTQGTRIAIEFGIDSLVRAQYDDHQGFYRIMTNKLIGDRAQKFQPIDRERALELLETLKKADFENAFIRAASDAAKLRDVGREAEQASGEVTRLREAANSIPGPSA